MSQSSVKEDRSIWNRFLSPISSLHGLTHKTSRGTSSKAKSLAAKRVLSNEESSYAASILPHKPRSHSHRNTWVLYKAVKQAIRTFQKDKSIIGGILFILHTKLCIRYGRSMELSEATTLRFENITYIVTKKIDRGEIGKGWMNDQKQKERYSLTEQSRACFTELRSIPNSHSGARSGPYDQPL
ncbi:hypothetical protein BDZ45DRAFT_747524 [Acephala macrosclerotiorum]|nr:hypothetical protein BDZ45DRAFT_747524 [Acephala macrosclerotiorum]